MGTQQGPLGCTPPGAHIANLVLPTCAAAELSAVPLHQ